MKLTQAEENYLKAIYTLSSDRERPISTNAIAELMHTSSASVTDMMQKLFHKELVLYQKYQGVHLTQTGKQLAIKVVRKHLLWEVFLVEKLKFQWGEIHEVAEQLEHVASDLLIERLDAFLGHPYCSPHGIVIPNANGEVGPNAKIVLTDLPAGSSGIVSEIKDDSNTFLQYLHKRNIFIGTQITIIEKLQFDESMDIVIDNKTK